LNKHNGYSNIKNKTFCFITLTPVVQVRGKNLAALVASIKNIAICKNGKTLCCISTLSSSSETYQAEMPG
jgi:hypothetical protein